MFKKVFNEFKAFALRGNVIDLAVGFTVGAAFSTIAKSLVDDIIMPPVGMIVGQSEMSDLYFLLKEGTEQAPPYATLADAQAAGAVTINYGVFINNVIAFLVIALVMFLIVRGFNRLENAIEKELGFEEQPSEPTTKKCPFCISTIPRRAVRCPACTSELAQEEAPVPA
ncbi:MAG: large conductance mechanosensitive channel protein MscL [Candidatus Promineifilaceae bacterium]|nr:large conductance mechanosensitive channel protein MscL [Candidatus Promineifilaceae bacterium]